MYFIYIFHLYIFFTTCVYRLPCFVYYRIVEITLRTDSVQNDLNVNDQWKKLLFYNSEISVKTLKTLSYLGKTFIK